MSEKGRLEALSRMIARELGKEAERSRLRVTEPDEPELLRMTSTDRVVRIRWLRALRRALKYMQVELFFQQALNGRRHLEDLADDELEELHATIEKARDHYHCGDGSSYYEAGLLRPRGEVA